MVQSVLRRAIILMGEGQAAEAEEQMLHAVDRLEAEAAEHNTTMQEGLGGLMEEKGEICPVMVRME